jgi:HPt (histidine-containing phosphotransfer) domain-containing protein
MICSADAFFHLRRTNHAMSRENQGDRPTSQGLGAFDLDSLQRRLGDDRPAAEAVLSAFARDAPRQIARLREALSEGASDQVRLVAHTLKGALLWIGANDAAASAQAMELNSSEDSPIAPAAALLKLSADVEHLLLDVRSRLSAGPD